MSEEYYAEDTFGGGLATSKVYTGPFLGVGFSTILGCFGMASITKVCCGSGASCQAFLPIGTLCPCDVDYLLHSITHDVPGTLPAVPAVTEFVAACLHV